MSTKTIALESSVYERLAQMKRPSESFTKAISRLMESASPGTCASAVQSAAALWESIGDEGEADRMEQSLNEARTASEWQVERPE